MEKGQFFARFAPIKSLSCWIWPKKAYLATSPPPGILNNIHPCSSPILSMTTSRFRSSIRSRRPQSLLHCFSVLLAVFSWSFTSCWKLVSMISEVMMKFSVLPDFIWLLLRIFAWDLSVNTTASLHMLIESMAWRTGSVSSKCSKSLSGICR